MEVSTKVSGINPMENIKNVPGMENFTAEDLVKPIVKLKQKTSEIEAGVPGQFVNTTSNKAYDSIKAILVTYKKDFKDWEDGKGPQLQYEFLALDAETLQPFIFWITGSSVWEAKRILTQAYQASEPLWSSFINIASEKKTNQKGQQYFVWKMNLGEYLSAEQKQFCLDYYNEFGKMVKEEEYDDTVQETKGEEFPTIELEEDEQVAFPS